MVNLYDEFSLDCGNTMKVTEVFCCGFNYHTMDCDGNFIEGQKYMLKVDFVFLGMKNKLKT